MTSEVALMNRSAVALAADSAATVTTWEEGQRKERYFKGANKIFNLSSNHPVGIMTYGAGSLQRMPWEVIIKAYRTARGKKHQDTLQNYSKDLFTYLANKSLFPHDYQERELIRGVCETAGNMAAYVLRLDAVRQEPDDAKRKTAAFKSFEDLEKEVSQEEFICTGCKSLPDETRKKYAVKIKSEFESGDLFKLFSQYFDIDKLLDLATTAFFKEKWTDLNKTGLVISGYGESEFFPSLEQYECFGVVLGTVVHRRLDDECKSITFETTSEIVPVAQDDMVNTFVFGSSMETLGAMRQNFDEIIGSILDTLDKDGHLAKGVDTGAIKAAAAEQFLERTREHIWKEHARPLRRVVGMLSVPELAELAETFVSIESLKERVTRHTETVSGPIDVAVITKGDGFIWMKRKHYFDPALNVRFVARKQYEAQE